MGHKATLTLLVILVLILTATTTFFATLHFQKDLPDCIIPEEEYVGPPEESTDSSLKTEVQVSQVADLAEENVITQEALQDLRTVLETQLPDYVAPVQPDYTIRINRQNGRYLNATLHKAGKFLPSFPSFYGYLSEEGWQIIFSGQDSPPCSKINALKFPKDLVVNCLPDYLIESSSTN